MFNVAIFKLKDITKYLVVITIIIFIAISNYKIFFNKKRNPNNNTNTTNI